MPTMHYLTLCLAMRTCIKYGWLSSGVWALDVVSYLVSMGRRRLPWSPAARWMCGERRVAEWAVSGFVPNLDTIRKWREIWRRPGHAVSFFPPYLSRRPLCVRSGHMQRDRSRSHDDHEILSSSRQRQQLLISYAPHQPAAASISAKA